MAARTEARHTTVAFALAIALLALTPASGAAAVTTFGSDLTAPAGAVEARQADTAYWQAAFADGRSPVAPVAGRITSFRVKGIALSSPVAGVPGGETDFHLQALRARPDGTLQILRTSQNFNLPSRGADPQTVTSYAPENFCVDAGDVLAFNTVGGWDAIATGNGPYPNGTPLQIFASVPGAVVAEFTGADRTNNGDVVTPGTLRGQNRELLMQLSVGTGPDAGPCASATAGTPPAATAPPPPPAAPKVQLARLGRQRVTVSSKGRFTVSLLCRSGPARCVGTLRAATRRARPAGLGSRRFDIAAGRTGRVTVALNASARRRFARARGRLAVRLVAVTRPGGADRSSTLDVTLRRRGR